MRDAHPNNARLVRLLVVVLMLSWLFFYYILSTRIASLQHSISTTTTTAGIITTISNTGSNRITNPNNIVNITNSSYINASNFSRISNFSNSNFSNPSNFSNNKYSNSSNNNSNSTSPLQGHERRLLPIMHNPPQLPNFTLTAEKPSWGAKLKMLFLTHAYNYESGTSRHFFRQYDAARRYEHVYVCAITKL